MIRGLATAVRARGAIAVRLGAAALGLLALVPAAGAVPLFAEATARLGSPQPCAGTMEGCYSNYVALADLDGDGDLDAVFASGGGYYVPGTAAPMAIYLGDGAGAFTEVNATAVGGFTGRLRQVAIGDLDGDGDLDLVAPDSWAMQPDAVFVNDGARPPRFTDEGAARLGTSSRAGAARLGDLDGDGDLDLVLTDWGADPPDSAGTGHVYANDGMGHFSELAGALPPTTAGGTGTGPIDADLLDADGDFDLDLVLASRRGESLYYVNDGTGRFSPVGADLPDQSGPYVYGPDPCDVDRDGDLDLWLDNGTAPLREQLVMNDGTGRFTDETAARVTGNPSADDNEVQCADVDGDGDLDAVVASLSDDERVLVNDGAGRFAAMADAFPPRTDATLGLDLGDVDGDGRLDAITAQGEQGSFLNRLYLGLPAQPVDTRAPRIRALETHAQVSGGRAVLRFAVEDAATSDLGPRLREAHLVIDGVDVPARFAGGDLYRASFDALTARTISVRACATDAHGTSGCSAETTVTVGLPVVLDGGPEADGGMMPTEPGGCCGAGGRGEPAIALAAAVLWFLRRRRARA